MITADTLLQNNNSTNPISDSLRIETSSVFSGHSLQPTHSTPIFNASSTIYWPGIFLFLIFSLYVFIKISEPKKIVKVFLSVFSLQEAKQLFREDFKLAKRVSVFLIIGFVLVMAFLIQYTNQYFGLILNDYSHLQQYLFFIAVLTLIYFIKYLSNTLLAFISNSGELNKEYLFNVFVFSQTVGIIIFPFIICLHFTTFPTELFLYPALIICSGFYALRMFRTFIISATEQNIGILYIFLYFCALEILPLLVLIKFLLVNFKN